MQEDVRIAACLKMTVLEYHAFLEKAEKLSARDLNSIAMQLLNRAIIKLEKEERKKCL